MITDNILEAVRKYVETGSISNELSKAELIETVKSLDETNQRALKELIRWELPMDDWAYIGPMFEQMPTASKWAVLAGVASGTAYYQLSKDIYSSVATGALTGALTFLGNVQYKKMQTKNLYDLKEQRAEEFLKYLPQENTLSIPIARYRSIQHSLS